MTRIAATGKIVHAENIGQFPFPDPNEDFARVDEENVGFSGPNPDDDSYEFEEGDLPAEEASIYWSDNDVPIEEEGHAE
jgi:hypothetical protein